MRFLILLALALVASVSQAQTVSRTDTALSGVQVEQGLQNAAASNYVLNDGKTLYLVKNNNVDAAVDATIKTQATHMSKSGYATIELSDVVVTVPSSSAVVLGPFPTSQFNDSNGLVRINLSSHAKVSNTAIRVR